MRILALAATVLILAGCPSSPFGPAQQNASQDIPRTLIVGGVERTFLLYVPPQAENATAANPLPVVFAFHWAQGTAAGMSNVTGFDDIAAREGFIVVYPEAIDGLWSDLRPGANPDTDNVAFIRAILNDLRGAYPIDARRIYATGLSAGGHMCSFLAFRTHHEIAAIAPVAALLAQPLAVLGAVVPPDSMPILTIAGTEDPIQFYDGGVVLSRGVTLSADDTVAFWVNVNNATTPPDTFDLPDSDPADGTITHVRHYPPPAAGSGAEVRFFSVEGGGHTWPGGPQYLPLSVVGPVSRDFSASEEIWSFFSRHSLP